MDGAAFTFVPSPLGRLLAVENGGGLVHLAFEDEDSDRVLRRLADELQARVVERSRRLERLRLELDEYFEGSRRRFDIRVDLRTDAGFHRRVLEATARIPYGAVSTYREVARMAGNARAARAAGNALSLCPVEIVVPCHRVVSAGAGIGTYGGHEERKEFLLRLEGAV